jgi:hypothetical protein
MPHGRLLPALQRLCSEGGGESVAVAAVVEAALSLSSTPPAALLAELLDGCGEAVAAACKPRVRSIGSASASAKAHA